MFVGAWWGPPGSGGGTQVIVFEAINLADQEDTQRLSFVDVTDALDEQSAAEVLNESEAETSIREETDTEVITDG